MTAKARELGFDAQKIIAFVRDDIGSDSYDGVLRGALGTLWDGSGSPDDRALLLQALLERAHRTTHLTYASRLGVEADLGNGFTYVGPGTSPEPGATIVPSVPAAIAHQLAINLVSSTAQGARTETLATINVADLVGFDLRLSYRSGTDGTVAVLRTPSAESASTVDASTATDQTLELIALPPGQSSSTPIRRRLFGLGAPFDATSVHTIVVSAGWIPKAVGDREGELTSALDAGASAGSASDRGAAHAVAYRFLAVSDAEAKMIATAQGVAAAVHAPRITIVSDMAGAHGRQFTLDLRADAVEASSADAAKTVTFSAIRSLYDAALESRVLSRTLGVPATSAADALASALAGTVATPAARVAVLEASLERLLGPEEGEGAALDVSVGGKADMVIHFERHGQTLDVMASPALTAALAGTPAAAVLATPTSDPAAAAASAELALVIGAHAGLGFHEVITHTGASPQHLFEGARLLFYGSDLGYELSAVRTDAGFVFTITNHYDINSNHLDIPDVSQIDVSADDLAHARRYTTYYGGADDIPTGRTWSMFSADAIAELKQPGGSVIGIGNTTGGVDSFTPVHLWAVGSRTIDATVNGAVRKVKVIDVAGDLEANAPSRPSSMGDVKARFDDYDTILNLYTIIDDPAFPFSIGGSSLVIQSAIPGRVVDARGSGIPGASISIAGSSTATWPDGSFDLPAIQQPYGTFDASISAPGFVDATSSVDLTKADSFPLTFTLDSAPPAEPIWATVDPTTVADALAGLGIDETAHGLISDALAVPEGGTPPSVAAIIPQGSLQSSLAGALPWVHLATDTGAAYVLGKDGLFGGSAGAPSGAILGAVGEYSAGLQCAYLKAASALDSVASQIDGGGSSGGGSTPAAASASGDSARVLLNEVRAIAAGLAGAPIASANPAQEAMAAIAQEAANLATTASSDSAVPAASLGGFTASGDGCSVEPAVAPAPKAGPDTDSRPFRPPWWPSVLGPVLILYTERDRRKKRRQTRRTVTVTGTVVRLEGNPAPGLKVNLGRAAIEMSTHTSGDGTFSFEVKEPGEYHLTVEGHGYHHVVESIFIDPSDLEPLVIEDVEA